MFKRLAAFNQTQLDDLMTQARPKIELGMLPEYIPLLADSNRRFDLAIQVRQINGEILSSVGAEIFRFPLMSLIKPFVLLYLLQQPTRDLVFARVDNKSSDLPKLGLLLVKSQIYIRPINQQMVNALMITCGLYEDSGMYAVKIGLPIKSGVSGGLLAIIPGEGAIATYSPPLDSAGNSVTGLWLIEQLAQIFNLSIFN